MRVRKSNACQVACFLKSLFVWRSEAPDINLKHALLKNEKCIQNLQEWALRGRSNNITTISLSLSALRMDLQLDWLKQRGAVKRILFMDSHQHHRTQNLVLGQGDRQHCHNYSAYLRVSLVHWTTRLGLFLMKYFFFFPTTELMGKLIVSQTMVIMQHSSSGWNKGCEK